MDSNNDKETLSSNKKIKEKSESSSLLSLYKFFHDSLRMKNQICRWFLFKPPSPRGKNQ